MFETIEDDGVARQVVFCGTDSEYPDHFAVGMLRENNIKGIIPPSVTVHNGLETIRYDISDLITLREYLSFKLTKRQILSVFRGIISTLEELESYLLDISLLFTDTGHIFIRNDDKEVFMLYLPVPEEHQSIHDMFKEIIFNTGFSEGQDGSYIAVILNELNSQGEFKFSDFASAVKRLSEDSGIKVKKYNVPTVTCEEKKAEEPIRTAAFTDIKPVTDNKGSDAEISDGEYGSASGFRIIIKKIKGMIFGYDPDKKDADTGDGYEPSYEVEEDSPYDSIHSGLIYSGESVSADPEETVMLTDVSHLENCPYLIRSSTGEKIIIAKPVFRIGKDERYADYIVNDNAAISRAHAEITVTDSQSYIRDEDSLNHTYVNGSMINSDENTIINDQDVIMLADEEYVFYR